MSFGLASAWPPPPRLSPRVLAAFAGVGVGAVSVNASRSVPWQPGHCCSWRRTASTRNQVPVHPHRSQAYVGTHTPSWHNGLPRNYRKAHAGWNATGASGDGFVTNGKRWGRLDAVVHGCGERRSDRSRLRGRLQAPTRLVVNMRRSANPEARAVRGPRNGRETAECCAVRGPRHVRLLLAASRSVRR